MAGDASLLPLLLTQLTQKETPPPADDNTLIQKMIAPNDSVTMDDSNVTLAKALPSAFVWGGKPNVTQMVKNSDFESVTSTATVLSDGLTSGATWTTQAGSGTFGASGWTSGATGSVVSAGNSAWKALTGSGGQNLALTVQASFTTPAGIPANNTTLFQVDLYQSQTNRYIGRVTEGNLFTLSKVVGGTLTDLATVAFTPAASSTYTITLSEDKNNLLTATLYSGVGTSTPIGSPLTATDTSLTGGFLIGVGGDAGVLVNGAQVSIPIPNEWVLTGGAVLENNNAYNGLFRGRILTTGKENDHSRINNNLTNARPSVAGNASYVFSVYGKLNSGVATTGLLIVQWYDINGTFINQVTQNITPTAAWTRYSIAALSPANAAQAAMFIYWNKGLLIDAAFDSLQFEAGTTATPYIRNDSTTNALTTPNGTYIAPNWAWCQGVWK